ncbi:MAG: carboxypeptidase-like regulatory domain-containing protein [Gemmatimonadetes bacterium]|nr:carboxypeptidase-like regulatory domain-containing protein [Gemmatimonadota bacterium]
MIRGRLVDAADDAPIFGGEVHLLAADLAPVAQVLTGERGEFRMVAPMAGVYRLRGQRLGYRSSTSEAFHLLPGDTVTMEFRLRVAAVQMEPITVVASSLPWGDRVGLVGMEEFFERYTRYAGTGFAEFMTRDSIAGFDNRVHTAGHMLQWVSRSVRRVDPQTGEVTLRNGCTPSYYLNGSRVPYEMVEPLGPAMLQAVEVYIRPAIPAELGADAPCGVVSYWSRQSPPAAAGSPILRTAALLALSGGFVLLLLGTAF